MPRESVQLYQITTLMQPLRQPCYLVTSQSLPWHEMLANLAVLCESRRTDGLATPLRVEHAVVGRE